MSALDDAVSDVVAEANSLAERLDRLVPTPIEQVALVLDPTGRLLAAINDPDDDDEYDDRAEQADDAARYESRYGGDS